MEEVSARQVSIVAECNPEIRETDRDGGHVLWQTRPPSHQSRATQEAATTQHNT